MLPGLLGDLADENEEEWGRGREEVVVSGSNIQANEDCARVDLVGMGPLGRCSL